MSTTVSRPALPRPDHSTADCRHSRAAFHCTFTSIASRRHLSSDAKLLHAGLVSMIRRRLEWTQAEIAAELGWESRQRVWRAASELVADDLLVIRRRGLGLPNEYILKPTDEISPEDIAAKAPRDRGNRSGHPEGRPRNTPARAFIPSKKNEERIDIRKHSAADYYQTSEGWRLTPRR